MFKNLINNIIKTVTGAAGQAVQKISSYTAPKPVTQPVQPSYTAPKSKLVLSSLTPDFSINQPAASAQMRTPTGIVGGGGGTTSSFGALMGPITAQKSSYVSPLKLAPTTTASSTTGTTPTGSESIFRNSLSSLIPKVYAATPAQSYTNIRQAAVNQGLIDPQTLNFGELIKNIFTPHTGSWGTNDYGLTEFAPSIVKSIYNFGAGLKPVNNLKDQGSFTGSTNTDLTTNQGTSMKTANDINTIRNAQGSAYNSSASGYNANAGVDKLAGANDAINAIDAQTEAKMNDLYNAYANGDMGQEEYLKRAAEEQNAAEQAKYDELIAQQQAEIPLLDKEFAQGKAEIEGQLPTQKATAERLKEENKNVYGEIMRKISKNSDLSMGNLRNMFGSLGTSESSAFINKAMDLEQEKGASIASTDREMAGKLADIDQTYQTFENDVKNNVSKLLLEKEKQLKTINDNVNMSRTQKVAATNEINANMYTQLATVKQQRDQIQQAFLNMKLGLVQNSGDLMKNAIVNQAVYGNVPQVQTYNSGVNNAPSSGSVRTVNGQKQIRVWDQTQNNGTGGYVWVTPEQSRIMSGLA